MTNRREFLKRTSALAGWSAVAAGCRLPRAAAAPYPAYENTLRDRLWMWGHDSGVYDGPKNMYNIPPSAPLSMADGIRSMGIPNVCVIRRGIPDAAYVQQFREVKRVAWSLAMGSEESYRELKDYVFGLRDTLPNLTGYYLDDFFHIGGESDPCRKSAIEPAPAALTIYELMDLYGETVAYKRRLDLAVVLYVSQLCPAIQPAMKYVDTISLWIWDGSDIQKIEEAFRKYRTLVPDKPTLLGIYMWDFGGQKELGTAFMARQLDYAFRLYKEGQIEGMIFHCTPLCNKGLAAVEYARVWIAEHGNEGR